MEIHGTSRLHSAQAIQGTHRLSGVQELRGAEGLHGADQVDISPEAEMISRVHDLPELRLDRVQEIRQQIAAGVYETSEKLDVALGRMLDEIAR